MLWMMGCVTITAQTLSLDSCKALAMRNNATVRNASLDVEAAREVKKQAFTKFFPQVTAIGGAYYAAKPLIEYSIDDIGNANVRQQLHNLYFEYGAAMGLPDRLSLCENGVMAGVTALQPVFMGGQIVYGNKLAEIGVMAAELQSQLTCDQVLQLLEETYWQTLSLSEKQKTLRQAMDFLDTLYRDVTTATNAGLVTKNDILKVTLKQDEIRSNMLKVENGIKLSTMFICQLIGIEYNENLTFRDNLPKRMNPEKLSEADVKNAVCRRRESQLLELQIQAEKLKKDIAIGESSPHLIVGASASYGNPVFDHFSANAMAFATLQVPLTGWWETAHKIRQQNFLIQKAENERTDLVAKMELETRQAWSNIEEADSQVALAETSVQNAAANLQDTKTNFEAGLVPVSELLEAQTMLLQTQNQLTDALIDLKIKTERFKTITR